MQPNGRNFTIKLDQEMCSANKEFQFDGIPDEMDSMLVYADSNPNSALHT